MTDEPQSDHRTRSAEAKRERMRLRLLQATLQACVEQGEGVIIEDVLRTAQVSRGTFYAHFDSLHAAISAAGQALADQEVADILEIYADVDDPLFLCAVGPQVVMAHAVVEPAWAYVLTQSDPFGRNSMFVSTIRHNHNALLRLRPGAEPHNADTLVDLNVAMMVQGARQLQSRTAGRWSYIQNAAVLLLRAMGIAEGEAWEQVRAATGDLRARGPDRLAWWREFD